MVKRGAKTFYHCYLFWKEFARCMKKEDVSAYAASTAFFVFLSLVPMLVMICTIIPFTPLTEADFIHAVTDLVPEQLEAVAEGLIAEIYKQSAGILSVALVATVWSAGKGVLALMRGLNALYEVEENRGYLRLRVVSSFYTLVLLLVTLLSLIIMVFGNKLVDILVIKSAVLEGILTLLAHFRFVVVWVILTALFAMMYAYIPNEKNRLRDQMTGAMFAAVLWSVFSWGFALYVDVVGIRGVYGSLSVVTLILLWLYVCMYIVMMGAYLNRYFTKINRAQMPKQAWIDTGKGNGYTENRL